MGKNIEAYPYKIAVVEAFSRPYDKSILRSIVGLYLLLNIDFKVEKTISLFRILDNLCLKLEYRFFSV
ncbi:MAG: hypothetical protein RSB70_03715 [Clostridium sp.]